MIGPCAMCGGDFGGPIAKTCVRCGYDPQAARNEKLVARSAPDTRPSPFQWEAPQAIQIVVTSHRLAIVRDERLMQEILLKNVESMDFRRRRRPAILVSGAITCLLAIVVSVSAGAFLIGLLVAAVAAAGDIAFWLLVRDAVLRLELKDGGTFEERLAGGSFEAAAPLVEAARSRLPAPARRPKEDL